MMRGLTRRIFGTANERAVKAYDKRVSAINGLEAELEALQLQPAAHPHHLTIGADDLDLGKLDPAPRRIEMKR